MAMNSELVRRLLLYIADQLQDMEAPISTTRLVKFLYLIDLEHYNHYYKTLTGIDWVKYDHGPYFFAWPEVLRSTRLDLEPEEVETERGRGITFHSLEPHDISDAVSFATQARIGRILSRWAYEDLNVLLHHVYETLPVRHGIYCQELDFMLETDHLLLEEATDTATHFLTLDELMTDYEAHSGGDT